MANISFANLSVNFSIMNANLTTFSSADSTDAGFEYSYLTSGAHDWEFDGVGVTTSGGLPTGGTVNNIQLDLGNNNSSAPEIVITGLGGIPITAFGIGAGSAGAQRDSFWRAAFGGADTFNFSMTNYAAGLVVAGDGASITSGSATGGVDQFLTGGAMLTDGTSAIVGDFYNVSGGSATGGNDNFTVGARDIIGDFYQVSGAGVVATGGDDSITPAQFANLAGLAINITGDAASVIDATLNGGDDYINLYPGDISALGSTRLIAVGDVIQVSGAGSVVGGADYIIGSSAGDEIYGDIYGPGESGVSGGDDAIYANGGDDTVYGQSGDDYINGGPGADLLDGGSGNDWLVYNGATSSGVDINLDQNTATGDIATGDTISGFEYLQGSQFGDSLTGTDNLNYIIGDAGADVLKGMGGDDRLTGDAGDDTILGDDGYDYINGGAGADVIDGGADADFVDYSASSAGVTIKLWAETGVGGDAEGDTLTKIENLYGSDFNDRLIGLFNQNNYFYGFAGNDYFDGFAGADSLFGGDGDDRMIGGAGGDFIDGEAGHDLASYGSSQAAINVNLATLVVSGGDAAGDTLLGVEGVIGTAYADTLTGNASYNTLQANGGADLVDGGAGYDFINGHNGADTLIGGTGNDTLIGGLHDDRFVFRPGDGADRINDFGVGGATGSDLIQLQGYGAAFDTFAEVMAATSQVGADTVINFGGGNTITLIGINKASLNPADFVFI